MCEGLAPLHAAAERNSTAMRSLKVAFSLLLICLLAVGQTALDNATILKLVKAGIGEDTIVGMVNQQPGTYALSADDIIALKNAGVTDKVIAAMVVRNGATPQPAPTQPTAANATIPSQPSAATPLIIHDATPIRLRLNRNLSSADAKTGDTVDFDVLDDLKVDEVMLIPRGSTAIATVTEADHKKRMARGGKLDLNIDFVRLVTGDKVALRAVKEVKGGGHTGAMTGAMVATAIVVWPAAPFFLFMHGKDVTIPKGTEITAYVDGEIKLERARFGPSVPAQTTRASLPPQAVAPPPNATPVSYSGPAQRAVTAFVAQSTPVAPAAAPQAQAEEKPKLTITSNPSGAAVEINGIAVGSTPATVALAKGASFKLTVKMDGYLPWEVQSVAVDGQHTMNAALSKVVVFE
jgi:hypothetical protein